MYALLIVDIVSKIDQKPLPQNFLREIETLKLNDKEVEKIFSGVWLLDLKNSLTSLRQLWDLVERYNMPCKLSFFENKPEFIT